MKDAAIAFGQFGTTPEILEEVLNRALSGGATWAELFFERTASTAMVREGKKLERIQEGKDCGVGLRVLFDLRTAYAYTTNLSRESLLELASRVAAQVKAASKGKAVVKSARTDWRSDRASLESYRVQINPRSVSLKERAEVAKRIEAGAYAEFPDARQVTAVSRDALRELLVVNSDGAYARDQKTYFHMVCQVVGQKDGRIETAYESNGGYVGLEFMKQNPPEEIGREAARRVKVLLSAVPAPAGLLPVVLSSEAGGTMIHEAVGHGLEADLACNGLSVYEGKIGKKVASDLVTVLDDGTMEGMRGSYAYDDEGTPSASNTLIENGVLKSYMVDRLSALKFDLSPTGNGRRESFRYRPIVRMTNTYVAPGPHDPKKILAETSFGLFVKAMGGGQVNTVTGDFVFAVTEGYLIRSGKIAEPIRGATLVGNGPHVLSIVDRVGSDLGFDTGTCGKDGQGAPVTDGQPTMRIPELTVGGEVTPQEYWPQQAGPSGNQ